MSSFLKEEYDFVIAAIGSFGWAPSISAQYNVL